MAEKEIKSCSDCIHYDVCYKIEHYGRDLEDTSACKLFIGKDDVAPVKHGHWIKIQNYVRCSECRHEVNWSSRDFLSTYCPNCGAKMDGGEGNEQSSFNQHKSQLV